MDNKSLFSNRLIAWNRNQNTRKMPWKGEKDPYKIWISEIILQQTRVQQGLAYYSRFIETFPNIKSLAKAPDQKIYKLWEGLGYYSRCRNLISTAKFIHNNLNDTFPNEYKDILSLKGIGPYTAAAIASFAFDLPYAVVDGNVFRVLSRFFGIEKPINIASDKKYYSELAQALIDIRNPAEYNQAIMDFGAVICKPAVPLCPECPFQKKCIAFLDGKVSLLPVNKKMIKQKVRFFNYLLVEYGQKVYVKERLQKDIWQNLYEFILIENHSLIHQKKFLESSPFLSLFEKNSFQIHSISTIYSQKLTHQLIKGQFFNIRLKKPLPDSEKYKLVSKKQLSELPFPKFIASYLTDKNVSLNLFQDNL